MSEKIAQMNKIQIRAEVLTVISKFQIVSKTADMNEILKVLKAQQDKKTILEVLLKEFARANEQKALIISFLIMQLCEKKDAEPKLWELLKGNKIEDYTKTFVLNILKEYGNKVDYDSLGEYFDNPDEVIDADTKKLLSTAIVNPEAQIDFMDFLKSLSDKDREVLINSLSEDYTSDALANILNPVFLYYTKSNLGRRAAEILGETKSQLALHTLQEAKEFVKDEDLLAIIKKSISQLKISGIREDSALDFYKNLLSDSTPYKSYTSYPDGAGNQAILFSREREDASIRFVAIVINDIFGIVDCFGFDNITKVDFEKIIDRFYSGGERVYINNTVTRTLLDVAESVSRNTMEKIPYEYICWKQIFSDIPTEPVPIDMTLNMNFQVEEITDEDMKYIFNLDFIQKWFPGVEENEGFGILIHDINSKIKDNNFGFDLNEIVEESYDSVFDEVETEILQERIEMSAYLKYLSGENRDARTLYSLSKNKIRKQELALNIIRKGIYEYYVMKKFQKEEKDKTQNIFAMRNNPKPKDISHEQTEKMIAIVESLWVNE